MNKKYKITPRKEIVSIDDGGIIFVNGVMDTLNFEDNGLIEHRLNFDSIVCKVKDKQKFMLCMIKYSDVLNFIKL
jgi:hypothetical protein